MEAGATQEATCAKRMLRALSVFNGILRMASLKVIKGERLILNEQDELVLDHYDILTVGTSFEANNHQHQQRVASSKVRFFYRLAWWAFNLFNTFILIKFVYLSAVNMNNDRLLEKMAHLRYSPNLNWQQDNVCKSQTLRNINFTSTEREDIERLSDLGKQLDQLGSPIRSLIGLNSVAFIYAATASVCFNLLGYLSVWRTKPRLDLLNFIKYKEEERREFTSKLKNLIDLIFTVRKVPLFNRRGYQYQYTMKFDETVDDRTKARSRRLFPYARGCPLAYKCDDRSFNRKLVVDKELHRMLELQHLSDRRHDKICYHLSMVKIYRVILVSPAILTVIFSFICETVNRVHWRLFDLNCAHPKEISPLLLKLHSATFPLRPLEAGFDVRAYENFDYGWSAWLLALLVEARLNLTPSVLMTMFELTFAIGMSAVLMPLYSMLYTYDSSTKIIWLEQIEQQINKCVGKLTTGMMMTKTSEQLIWPPVGQMRDRRNNETLKQITLAYLNYEVFRREQRNYQTICNFLILQVSLLNACSLISCYYTVSTVKSGYNIVVLFLVSYSSVYLNLYFVPSAVKTNKMMRLMRNIYRMVAFSVDNSLRQTPIINLWAAQILLDSETKRIFVPRLFGISLTYDKVVAFNAYLMILWFLV